MQFVYLLKSAYLLTCFTEIIALKKAGGGGGGQSRKTSFAIGEGEEVSFDEEAFTSVASLDESSSPGTRASFAVPNGGGTRSSFANMQGDWPAQREHARRTILSNKNNAVSDILEVLEAMHEINETLGLGDGEADLVTNMSIDEKLDTVDQRLIVQNKFNEVIAKEMQVDHVSPIISVLGGQISSLQQQIGAQTADQTDLRGMIDELTGVVTKQGEYVKSLEKTIMSILSGGNGDGDNKHGLVSRTAQLENFISNNLSETLANLRGEDEKAKLNLSNLKNSFTELNDKCSDEFSEEAKKALKNSLVQSGTSQLKEHIEKVRPLWISFLNDISFGLKEFFQRVTKDLVAVLKAKLLKSITKNDDDPITEIDPEAVFYSEEYLTGFDKVDLVLVTSLCELRNFVRDSMINFEMLETEDLTIRALHPRLVAIHGMVQLILAHDLSARNPDSLGLSLDDFLCENRQALLRIGRHHL